MNESEDVYDELKMLRERVGLLETAPRLAGLTVIGQGGLANSNVSMSSLVAVASGTGYNSIGLTNVVAPTGPSRRLLILFGGLAWVTSGTSPSNNTQLIDLSPAITGANTLVAGSAGQIAHFGNRVASVDAEASISSALLLVGLNPGSNTIQLQAQGTGGNTAAGRWVSNPYLFVIPL